MTYARWFALASLLCACAPRAAQSAAPEPGNPPAGGAAAAEAPPGTDIFLAEIIEQGPLPQVTGEPRNLTRRAGYDNQPSFTPDGSAILYTSIRDGQADIFRYDVSSATAARVTSTPESEYSPLLMPTGDAISVIRVEADSTQRLWRFPLPAGGNPQLILEDVMPVGYHAWADAGTLALFVLGEPPTLQIADTGTGTARVVAKDIGRSLHKIPRSNAISFVDKSAGEDWWIRRLDLASGAITPLVQALPGSEDYAWTPAGTLLMAQGSTLHAWRQGGPGWVQIADFTSAGLESITRLAVSPRGDRLALVAAAR